MATRRFVIYVTVTDVEAARTPTPDECAEAIGIKKWLQDIRMPRPSSGQFLSGFRTDWGRSGPERAAMPDGGLADAAYKGRG